MDRRIPEVVHGAQFELSCRRLAPSIALENLEALLRVIKWYLSRAADDCPKDQDGLSLYRYDATEMYPDLVFYFTIDSDERCTLRYARLADD